MDTWFPRPDSPDDLHTLGPSGELGPGELFDHLTSPAAIEWRDKVGVSSPADGSAKSSTRLLSSRRWVFKTDTSQASLDMVSARAGLLELVALANRVELWHPDKRWFLLRTRSGPLDPAREHWWPVSVCPQLRSLRELRDWATFSERWAQVIGFALERSVADRVGLDLGPANFGLSLDQQAGVTDVECWYLDDETYAPLELEDVAQAIIARVPEWPDVDASGWCTFGSYLRGLLEPLQLQPRRWLELRERIADVPLAPRWHPQRGALLQGLGRPRAIANSSGVWPRRSPQRTAVVADIHANLDALEAVIDDAERERIDSWLLLGDVVGYGPDPSACIRLLDELPELIGVRGNHDHMACFGLERGINELARASLLHTRARLDARERDFLLALPVELRGPDWLAVHGAPIDPRRFRAYVYELNHRANLEHLLAGSRPHCFHGHTHVPRVVRMGRSGGGIEIIDPAAGVVVDMGRPGAMLINPGSVGQPRDGDPRAGYAIWDRVERSVQFRRVAYDVAHTRARLRDEGLPETLAARLALGR